MFGHFGVSAPKVRARAVSRLRILTTGILKQKTADAGMTQVLLEHFNMSCTDCRWLARASAPKTAPRPALCPDTAGTSRTKILLPDTGTSRSSTHN
jgi:hypothetical protein